MPHFKTSDGLNLHYTDQGAGLPILCLAGLTRSGRDFEFVAPHLHDVRLITLDYRGRGASDWADDFTTYAVPRETQDAIELLDDLGLEKVAILGTSRGGLNAMYMAATAKDRLLGVALNDVGPKLEQAGLDIISDYLGRRPAAKTHAEAAETRARTATGFANVPPSRWLEEARILYQEHPDGLHLTYDPKLRDAVMEGFKSGAATEAWPLFEACAGLPMALIHGANSDLLSRETALEMKRRMPNMILTHVPDRAHIPFLDEPESITALHAWISEITA
ncbi:MAG: alpha/beta hydrolase [Rhodobacteraceae bacterium]|nr:alpha/beta hydrolase [Paracoccaceae bacterium]